MAKSVLPLLWSLAMHIAATATATDTDTFACNNYKECASQKVGNGEMFGIECNAVSGCSSASLDIACSSGHITCNGQTSCYDSHALSSAGSILCSGYKSCRNARSITAGGDIVCSGWNACDSSLPGMDGISSSSSSSHVECSGAGSCAYTVIESQGSTQCSAAKACYHATIHSGAHIVCDAHKSCAKSKLIASDTLTISGKAAGYEAEISSKVLNAYAMYSAHNAIISATSQINAFGEYSLSYASVDNAAVSNLLLNAFGEMAGFGATVSCRGVGRICKIECKASGCYGMSITCSHGATCNISPDECNDVDGDRGTTLTVNGVHCPSIKHSQPDRDSVDKAKAAEISRQLEESDAEDEPQGKELNDDIIDALLLADSVYDLAATNGRGAALRDHANSNAVYMLYSNIITACIVCSSAITMVRRYFGAKHTH